MDSGAATVSLFAWIFGMLRLHSQHDTHTNNSGKMCCTQCTKRITQTPNTGRETAAKKQKPKKCKGQKS